MIIYTKKGEEILVDAEDYPRLIGRTWRVKVDGSAQVPFVAASYKLAGKQRTLVLSRFIMQAPKDKIVIHLNRDFLDNQKQNLRVVNRQKCSIWGNKHLGYSGFRGVTKSSGKAWKAEICLEGRRAYLGAFAVAEDAARAYDKAAKSFYGDLAQLNFPEEVTNDGV